MGPRGGRGQRGHALEPFEHWAVGGRGAGGAGAARAAVGHALGHFISFFASSTGGGVKTTGEGGWEQWEGRGQQGSGRACTHPL